MQLQPLIEVTHDFDRARPDWLRLEADSRHHPFQTIAWLEAWHQHVGSMQGLTPLLVIVRSPDQVPWMLLPMARSGRRPGRTLCWLGGALSDYHGPLLAPGCPSSLLNGPAFAQLWARILSEIQGVDVVHLERLLPTLGAQPNPFLQLGAQKMPSSAHTATLRGDWAGFYASKASRRTRSLHRRKARRLEQHGALQFLHPSTPAEVDRTLQVLYAFKSRSWRELGARDLFDEPGYRDFVRHMTLQHPSLVHLRALQVGDQIISAHWGLLYQERLYYMLPTYQPGALAKFSPGTLLCLHILEWCLDSGVRELDFTLGDEAYKDRWCDVTTPVYELIQPVSRLGRVRAMGLRSWSLLKKRIKADPTLYPLSIQMRARLRWGHQDAASDDKSG